MDLDERLHAAAPPTTARTPQLQRELFELVAATEAAQPRPRMPVRLALVGSAVAGLLGVGAVASAAGVLPGWPSFSTSSGQTCQVEISAAAMAPGEGEPVSATFGPEEREKTLAEAQRFLAEFDYDAVDRSQAVAWWQTEESRAIAAQPDPAERQPRLTGDDLEVTAVAMWVGHLLRSHLAAQGLDVRAISVASANGCVR